MHNWSYSELRTVCICYKENLPIQLALKLTNTTDAKSMEMRYRNCLFLDKGRVENALSHPSKTLVKAWEDVEEMYASLPPPKEEEFNMMEQIILIAFIYAICTSLFNLVIG